ncbi:hypothetical protein GCM10007853_08170 [Algimonas ampicilliniresistens]|uniref:Uncharacterized protein n=1 Tax=Algimonas ampicilliniresistens TaxID=1298735 RepID=A0ABQ5V7V9_9PROT|nr:hypothetical protein GCM10007853_08170 [Algimonas ampicilliniresistens]
MSQLSNSTNNDYGTARGAFFPDRRISSSRRVSDSQREDRFQEYALTDHTSSLSKSSKLK